MKQKISKFNNGLLKVILICMIFVFCVIAPKVIADTANHDVTLTISSISPEILYITNPGSQNPTSGSVTPVYLEIHVRDNNTISDIRNVTLAFFKSGGTNRTNQSCQYTGDLGSNVANYTCIANMEFFDADGSWQTHVFANDTSSNNVYNSSWIMTYNQLHDFNVSVASINFGSIAPSSVNQTSTNDPEILQNIGNVAIATVNVTGYDVKETSGHTITATNFSVGAADDCAGNSMLNATSLVITGISVAVGQASYDNMYYCIPSVPSGLNNGAYSDIQNWVITSIA